MEEPTPRTWITTPVPADGRPDAAALLARSGVQVPSPAAGSVRRLVGGIDLDESPGLRAVAVVDVDRSGSAWLRAVAADSPGTEERLLEGLADTLRAAGVRRLIMQRARRPPAGGSPVGWRRLGGRRQLWAVDL